MPLFFRRGRILPGGDIFLWHRRRPRPQAKPRSWTLACSHKAAVALVCRFYGLHPCNPCEYIDYYSFADPGGMEGWVGLVGWLIADSLPTKWSPVNHRSGAEQGQRPPAKTGILTTTQVDKRSQKPCEQTPAWADARPVERRLRPPAERVLPAAVCARRRRASDRRPVQCPGGQSATADRRRHLPAGRLPPRRHHVESYPTSLQTRSGCGRRRVRCWRCRRESRSAASTSRRSGRSVFSFSSVE